jgi:hypothetical protein
MGSSKCSSAEIVVSTNSMTSLMLDDIQHNSLSSMESDFASPDAQLNFIYKLDRDTSHWVVLVKVFSLANTNSVGREDEL